MSPNTLSLPHGTLDLTASEVRIGTNTHTLSEREVAFLGRLAQSPGKPVSTDDLAAHLGINSKSLLKNLVRRLRSKLEPDPTQPTVLVRRYGGTLQFNIATAEESVVHLDAASVLPEDDKNPLFGRVEEQVDIFNRLKKGQRMVTILGSPGAGKTRLAEAIVEEASAKKYFPGGVIFRKWASCQSPLEALADLAQAMGLPFGPIESPAQVIKALGKMMSFREPTLVVLDNLEHLSPLIGKALDQLFRLAPRVGFVLTSRKRLMAQAEHVVRLAPLPDMHGVKLFLHRARMLGHDVTEERSIVEALVARLEGSPLAILMVSSRIGTMGLEGLRDWAATQLLERVHVLKQTIEWSWSLLSQEEQAALTQCAVFRAGFDLELAEDVIFVGDDAWTEEVLFRLLKSSLIWISDDQRIHLYQSVRGYVLSKQKTPPDDLIQRFVTAHITRAERVQTQLQSGPGGRVLQQIHEVLPNWLDAQRWAQRTPSDAVLPLITVTGVVLERQGRTTEIDTINRSWLSQKNIPTALAYHILGLKLQSAMDLNLYKEFDSLSKALMKEAPGLSAHAILSNQQRLFSLALYQRRYQEVCDWSESVADQLPEAPPKLRARVYAWWGMALYMASDMDAAIEKLNLALSYTGHVFWRHTVSLQLGACLIGDGRIQEGLAIMDDAHEQTRQGGAIAKVIFSSLIVGGAHLRAGNTSAAHQLFRRAWSHALQLPPHFIQVGLAWNYAVTCLVLGDVDTAESVLAKAFEWNASFKNPECLVNCQLVAAAAAAMKGDGERFEGLWGASDMAAKYWVLSEEEIDAVAAGYRALMSANGSTGMKAVKELLAKPIMQLYRDPKTDPPGRPEHELHVLILGAWLERGA